jgi:NADPH:quinone reductase-like Zn-dependent oxidoreductase
VKAIVRHRYGLPDVLQLQDVAMPTPAADEILIHVQAASVNPYDWHMMTGKPYIARLGGGFRQPTSTGLGADVAGRVTEVGPGVTGFQPGDEVFGQADGSYAEYVCLRAKHAALKPANLTFEQAAAVPIAGVTALQALRDKGHVATGQHVLVNGASGGVGTFAVQIAKSYGAHVTGVCGTGNVELVRSLGADEVIDYTQDDFSQSGEYDLVLDVMGNRSPWDYRRVLRPTGTLVVIGAPKHGQWIGPLVFVAKVLLTSLVSRPTMAPILAAMKRDDLITLAVLMESGKLAPVIDRTFPLSAVPDALTYMAQGHTRGKVVIAHT